MIIRWTSEARDDVDRLADFVAPHDPVRAGEPEHGLVSIGSGGSYAHSAARALLEHTELAPRDIVKKSLEIAAELCIYTNQNHVIETLD